jgi:two-component system phosphate regulon response regulator PhoB
MTRVLVVEDEAAIAELIGVHLRHAGFEVVLSNNAEDASQQVNHVLPDVVLLDWMLPGQSGVQMARKWRSDSRTRDLPIIMLTARSEETDKVMGLDAGADDYVTKPFSAQELLARIRAVLRRKSPESLERPLQVAELKLDPAAYRVTFKDAELKLGPTEFKLLNYLMTYPERVHTRSQLLDKVWGDHVFIEERTVDVHIKRLREALSDASRLLETVRGAGYRLSAMATPVSSPKS